MCMQRKAELRTHLELTLAAAIELSPTDGALAGGILAAHRARRHRGRPLHWGFCAHPNNEPRHVNTARAESHSRCTAVPVSTRRRGPNRESDRESDRHYIPSKTSGDGNACRGRRQDDGLRCRVLDALPPPSAGTGKLRAETCCGCCCDGCEKDPCAVKRDVEGGGAKSR